jgi:catechol 2,3-dioxygenase-like lactoylglutathione lyase family enzyme
MSEKLPPVFNQLNIVSGDLAASLKFYRQLGVEIPENAIWKTPSGNHHITAQRLSEGEAADLDIDSAAFARVWNSGWKDRRDLAGRVVIGFGVSSREGVDALYAEMMAAGYRGLQSPYDALWGARYAVIEDPDGIAVGIMSPVSAEHRSPPPAI